MKKRRVVQEFFLQRVREQSEEIWQDRVCGLGLRLMLIFGAFAWGSLAITFKRLPPEVPLWFSKPWGASQLAQPMWLVILPVSLVMIGMVTITWAGMIYKQEKLLARMLVWGGALVGFLLTYALIRILWLAL